MIGIDLNAPITWAGTRQAARSAFEWWTGELSSLIPKAWRGWRMGRRQPRLELLDDGNWQAKGFSATYDGPLIARADLLTALGKVSWQVVPEIILPHSNVLTADLDVPRLAGRRLGDAIRLQIDRLSPIPPSETTWSVIAGAAGRAHVVMARRSYLRELTGQLRGAGFRSFKIVDPAFGVVLHIEDRGAKIRRNFVAAAWAIALMTWVGAWWAVISDLESRREQASEAVLALRPQAEAVSALRREVMSATGLAEELSAVTKMPPVLRVWADVTQVLPDDAWLTSIEVVDGQLRVEGYARSPADVLASFANAPSFISPAFEGALQRYIELGADRFVLRAELTPVISE